MPVLRDRQKEIFAQRYTASGCKSAIQAGIDAGLTKDNAKKHTSAWLDEPVVMARIDELLRPLIRECDINRQKLIEQLARIAFSDWRRLYNEDGSLMKWHELDEETAAVITSYTPTTGSVKIADKLPAIKMLAEIYRVIDPEEGDNKGVTVIINRFGKQADDEPDFS